MARDDGQIDSSVDIVTPENIAFQYQLAGPFRRLPAYLIDIAIRVAILVFSIMLLGFSGLFGFNGVGGILTLLYFVLEWFYGGLFEAYWNGQTPGKRITGIRVLSRDGHPINAMQAILRNILRAADMAPVLPFSAFGAPPTLSGIPTFAVALISQVFSRSYQRLGDVVCGTIVVVEDRSWLFGVNKLTDPRVAQLADHIPANFQVSRQLSRALATYVERRKFFSPARRREIARHIAQPLLQPFNLEKDTSYDLLVCALYHRTFVADQWVDQAEFWDRTIARKPEVRKLSDALGSINRHLTAGRVPTDQEGFQLPRISEARPDEERLRLIRSVAQAAAGYLGISLDDPPEKIVGAVEECLKAVKRGEEFLPDKNNDADLLLGSLWGTQVVRGLGWEWVNLTFHDDDNVKAVGLVSPSRDMMICPFHFVHGCIENKAIVKILLSYEMIRQKVTLPTDGGAEQQIPMYPDRSFVNVMEHIHHVVPTDDYVS